MSKTKDENGFTLEEQIGFLLRQAHQRHALLFTETINESLTPTQFAVLAKLSELQTCSQNELGRLTAMDAATVKGVVERLKSRKLLRTGPDKNDRRRLLVSLTKKGERVAEEALSRADQITEQTLQPLTQAERRNILRILKKMR
jgi:DNA-binding MarR family transcriptional regulator